MDLCECNPIYSNRFSSDIYTLHNDIDRELYYRLDVLDPNSYKVYSHNGYIPALGTTNVRLKNFKPDLEVTLRMGITPQLTKSFYNIHPHRYRVSNLLFGVNDLVSELASIVDYSN